MNVNEAQFLKFVECLKECGVLADVIVIGSWAEYIYDKSGLLDGFHPEMKTTDADFLIPNLRRPNKPISITETVKRAGFIYDEDRFTGASRFIGQENFEIEFLIAQRGAGTKKLPRTNLGVNAQQLTHLGILSQFSRFVSLTGCPVRVPEPEAYALHKMMINRQRMEKSAPDRIKIKTLLPYLDIDKLAVIYQTLRKKEAKEVNEYIIKHLKDIDMYSKLQEMIGGKEHTEDGAILAEIQSFQSKVRKE